jgi:chorismate mutase
MNSDLNLIRSRIDILDNKIASLLKERLSLVLELSSIKDRIEDADRENFIIERLTGDCSNQDEKDYICSVYEKIFQTGKRLMFERKDPERK